MEVPAIPFTTLSSRFTPSLRTHTTMNLTELKNTPVSELITLGENMGLENNPHHYESYRIKEYAGF